MAQLTEHMSKQLLSRFGLPIGTRVVAVNPEEASSAAERLGLPVMIKAQVPAGGRGKAGAIRRADTLEEAARLYDEVTSVRFGDMQPVEVLIEPVRRFTAEYYLAVVIDSWLASPVVLFTAGGGVEVEAGSEISRIPLRPDGSMPGAALRRIAYDAGVPPKVAERLISVAQALVRAHSALDAQLVEVNPLALLEDGQLLALDARLIVDDNALFRQLEQREMVHAMRPRRREDVVRDATRLEYVRLDGWLGLISSGAGMTMAAMDLVGERGGEPACFLDCSANPTPNGYGAAVDLMLEDPAVRAILISIFGGLTQTERVARTLVKVFSQRTLTKPVTLRLMGTNIDAADPILEAAGLKNYRSFEEAVDAAVASVKMAEDMAGMSR